MQQECAPNSPDHPVSVIKHCVRASDSDFASDGALSLRRYATPVTSVSEPRGQNRYTQPYSFCTLSIGLVQGLLKRLSEIIFASGSATAPGCGQPGLFQAARPFLWTVSSARTLRWAAGARPGHTVSLRATAPALAVSTRCSRPRTAGHVRRRQAIGNAGVPAGPKAGGPRRIGIGPNMAPDRYSAAPTVRRHLAAASA